MSPSARERLVVVLRDKAAGGFGPSVEDKALANRIEKLGKK